MKKLILSLFTLMLLMTGGMFFPINAEASSLTAEDPLYGRANGRVDEEFFDADISSYSLRTYADEHSGNYICRKGIDVSRYQSDIDWQAVKNSGVEFAIVRVAYRGLNGGLLAEDPLYRQHIEGALNAGLKVGVYVYSQAITPQEAVEEANYVLSRIYPYNIALPVVIDYEYGANNSGRLAEARLSRQAKTEIVNAFCKRVSEAGYTGMVYANKSMLRNDLDASAISDKYKVWLANYAVNQWHTYGNATSNYEGTYQFFQFSSEGQVPGINGYVDLDYWYDDGTINGKDYGSVFDAQYYAAHNPDVVAALGNDPSTLLTHFITHGMKEGRQGNETFNVRSYANQYADLRAAYKNNLPSYYQHYMSYGKSEGRKGTGCTYRVGAPSVYNRVDYSGVYDGGYYSQHQDLMAAYGYDDMSLLAHFVNFGMKEGRQAISSFNVYSYKNTYPDLRKAYGNDLKSYYLHYVSYGRKEQRKATGAENTLIGAITVYNGKDYSAVYDYNYYVAHNPDVKAAFGLDDQATLAHFVNFGMKEGRQAISSFNVYSYKNTYPDLRKAYGNDLKSYYLHYVSYGRKEQRKATGAENTLIGAVTVHNGQDYSAVYDYNYYVAHNPDIKAAFGLDDQAVLSHFVNHGMNEGRQAVASFNVYSYKNTYPDLRRVYANNLKSYYMHYIAFGQAERRRGTGSENQLLGGVTVYNGVDYAAVYDYNYYVNHNADIKKAYGFDDQAVLSHFVNHGMNEGRQAKEDFSLQNYKNRYEDLRRAFGNQNRPYYLHYISNGRMEGRNAK